MKRYILFWMTFMIFCLPAFAGLALAASALRITSIEFDNSSNIPTEQIRSVLPLHENDPYDPVRVEEAVAALQKWGRFEEIHVDKKETKNGVVLRFILKEGYLVSEIIIKHGYPYLSTRLRRTLTIRTGDLYRRDVAEDQAQRLVSFFERAGYEGTEVEFRTDPNPPKMIVDLVYDIRKGKRYRLGEVKVEGHKAFPHGYFVSQLNPLRLYQPSRFRDKIDKMRRDYQKKGYLKARVRIIDLGKDERTRKVNPTLQVTEGKHVEVVFRGNRRVSRATFKKILPIYSEGGYGDYELQASAKVMTEYYRRRGFQKLDVKTETQDLGNNRLRVIFSIQEGPQTYVKKVQIEGHQEVPSDKIKEDLLTREDTLFSDGFYDSRLVDQDVKNLPKILQSQGALDGKSLGQKTSLNQLHDQAVVTFEVDAGRVTYVKKVEFQGNTALSSHSLKKRLKLDEGDPFSAEKVQRDEDEMTLHYANQGFPYARVTHELVPGDQGATLVYHVDEGVKVTVGEILVTGNERTKQKAVERLLLLKRGKHFSAKKLLESQSSLRRTGSFRTADIETIGLSEKQPVVHLVVKLEEYPKMVLDLGATYDTDRFITGNVTLSHVNLLGTAKRGVLKLVGGRDIQKGEVVLKDPNLLGYFLEGSVGAVLDREIRPGFETIEAGGNVAILKAFTPRSTFVGRYDLTRTFFTDVTDTTGLTEEDHTISKFSFSYSYDRRDSFADPQRGFIGFVGLDISNKLIASTFDFLQPKGYFSHYLQLNSRMTLVNFIRMEVIQVLGDDVLTRDKKLFLGGDYSVRGFEEDTVGPIAADGRPSGGEVLILQTTELQTRIVNNFKLALFSDNGSLTDRFDELGRASLRHSAGVGLRYVTPVGPLRLDYGFKLDQATGESLSRLHFAFGYAF